MRPRDESIVHDPAERSRVPGNGGVDRLGEQILGAQDAEPHEAPLVDRVERAEDGAERILGELRDEQVIAEVALEERGRGRHEIDAFPASTEKTKAAAFPPSCGRRDGSRRRTGGRFRVIASTVRFVEFSSFRAVGR